MNNTNRGLNRLLVGVVGIVLLAVGAAILAALYVPEFGRLWTQGTTAARDWLAAAESASRIGDSAVTWLEVGLFAVIVVLVVLLLALPIRVVTRSSRPRERGIGHDNPLGRVVVSDAFSSDALRQALASRDEILSSNVGLRDVRGTEVLQVAVTPRQSTPPDEVVGTLDRLLDGLEKLTGPGAPAIITIHSGLRTKFASEQRRVD